MRSVFRLRIIGLSEVMSLGYRIVYDGREGKYEVKPYRPLKSWLLAGLLLLLVFALWKDGADYIREALIPGENAVTVAAFENMTERLRRGETLREAVTAFCSDVIHGTVPAN